MMFRSIPSSLAVLLALFLGLAEASANKSPIEQRPDSCVLMPVDEASVAKGKRQWSFDLSHPGNYVVELVLPLEQAYEKQLAAVSIDGVSLKGGLEKSYIIEDGLVSGFVTPAKIEKAGRHTLTLDTDLQVRQVRLVPEGYVKSRIYIASEKYYEPWLEMHQSAPKVAAMEWYKNARFGMFIHWGAYSMAAGSWKGVKIEDSPISGPRVAEWLMFTFNISREEYREYAKRFNPDSSFAENFASLAKETGMRYMVITSKHHDGFALFDSAYSDFDIADHTAYDGDLIKELYDACRAKGIDFGVYYSHGNDWMDGGDGNYANVKARNDVYGVYTRPNGKNLWDPSPNSHAAYLEEKAYPQVAELIKLLPDLRLIWFDGDGLITEEQSFRFYKMVYDLNPNIVVNRRIGYNFGDYVDAGDNKTPTESELAAKHFETCGTANHSWGFKAHDHDWHSSNELLRKFVDIVSKGGNYLLNIGPEESGKVPEPCVDGFREMGKWVKTNSEAIFGTRRWTKFNENVQPSVRGRGKQPVSNGKEFWFSAKGDAVYAMSLADPGDKARIQSLGAEAGKVTSVRLLGSERELKWKQSDKALEVDLSGIEIGPNGYALKVILK
ncbi:alpha-L-fucosidase [Pelagicoccus sp. SDUM812005]|uniref:alpha-L-fucosidase n=1 Tax=Pelagicoccus sp. SDUM812005 TaxID=3041257 RepID=UPI00280EDE2B|nr:alpha-L-fucosidase [Pelagicoccus sp. SDUM812005]MDQ8179555.1 alpha-L-fucosidase [Pelagicoccus sp. SDUM812005]